MINKILIVDDSPVARKMLKAVIPKDRGYELLEAVNGQDGAEKYKDFNPDVTLMDLTMPVLDGFGSMTEILKNLPPLPATTSSLLLSPMENMP